MTYYETLMDFLNRAYSEDGDSFEFQKLLPKLYKEERKPWESNYVLYKDGKIVAAVGVYQGVLQVGTERLRYVGIGNVAVDKAYRNQGLMRECMQQALDSGLVKGADFLTLGGQRQRYGYFGFETVGIEYRATINRTNIRHAYSDRKNESIEIKIFDKNNQEILDAIYLMHQSREFHTQRSRETFIDILCSWLETVYVIFKNGKCIGYFVGNIQELTLESMDDFPDVMHVWLQENEEVEIVIPAWDYKLLDAVSEVCEYLDAGANEMFCILNYKKVLKVLLGWKAQHEKLTDGQIRLCIQGDRIHTKISVKIENNSVLVEEYDGDVDIHLSEKEALRLFFGLYSSEYRKIRPEIRNWFPLPIYIEHADEV